MKICILSDSIFIPTGYRNNALQLAQHLTKQGHEVHYMANSYIGMQLNNAELYDGTKINFKIYGEMQNQYFRNTMSHIIKSVQADRFIILLDTFMLHGNDRWFLNVDTSPAKTFFWFPTDGGGGLPLGCENILKKVNVPVAMSEFGQKQVRDYHGITTNHIPHCVDTEKFFRLDDNKRNQLRAKFGLHDKFVIGVVARNQPRKQLDKTLKIMCKIRDRIPNAVLFMHLDADDPAQPLWNMRSMIRKFNLENRVVFSGMKAFQGVPDNEMINIYNLMDCFLLTTSGEGFGIPIIEAMACEVPVLATDYTTTPELVIKNKAGFGINLTGVDTINMFDNHSKVYDSNVMNGTITGSWEVERAICDINDAANKLEILYKDPSLRKEMGKNGFKAVKSKYDCKIVLQQWDEILK